MRQISYVLLGAILCLLASCVNTVQEAFIPIDGSKLEVTAYAPDGSATKTGITENESGGKNVIWKAGNSISLFFNSGENGGNKFTTADGGLVAKFTGSISAISGDLSGTGGKAYFWAVYPYSGTVSCDGTGVTTSLPATQSAYVNDIADNLLVTVGRSENLSIYFRNTCTVIEFTLSQENISKITFSGNNNELVAGEFKASFDSNNKIVHSTTSNSVKSIEITPAETSTFVTGKKYYFVFLPGTFSKGYSLTFTRNDGYEATYTRSTAFTFNVGTFYTMNNKDRGLTFQGGVQPNNEIWYKTSNGKTISLEKDDFGASLLSNQYEGDWGVIRCDGAITKIPSLCFYKIESLTEVHLPTSVQIIERTAFCDVSISEIIIPNGCICEPGAFAMMFYLERLIGENVSEDGRLLVQDNVVIRFAGYGLSSYEIPDGITGIGEAAFSGCRGLRSISFPNTIEELGEYAFQYCSLSSLELPERISTIPSYCFNSGITSLSLPSYLRRIEDYAFQSDGIGSAINLSTMSTFTIPALVTYIGEGVSFVTSASTVLDPVYVLAATPPTLLQEHAFGDYYEEDGWDTTATRILVPKSSISLYKADPMWSKYNIGAIEDW